MTNEEKIIKLLNEKNGYITTEDIIKLNISKPSINVYVKKV